MLSIFLMLAWLIAFGCSFYILSKINKPFIKIGFILIACLILAYFSFVITTSAIAFQIISAFIFLAFLGINLYKDKITTVFYGFGFYIALLIIFAIAYIVPSESIQRKYLSGETPVFADELQAKNNDLVLRAILSRLNDDEKAYLAKTYQMKILTTESFGGNRCLNDLNSFACDGWITSFLSLVKLRTKSASCALENQNKEREAFKEKYKLKG